MEKKALMEGVLEKLAARRAQALRALEGTRQAALDSPSAIESHSDTTKNQMQRLYKEQEASFLGLEKAIALLASMSESLPDHPETAVTGAVVELTEEGRESSRYFLLPEGSGTEVDYEGSRITVITPRSPLAAVLMGAARGARVALTTPQKVREMHIADIW